MLATRKVEAMLVHFNDDVARPFPSSTNKLLLAYLDGREKRRSRRRACAALYGRGERGCCHRHRAYVLEASYLGGIFTAVAEQHANSLAKMS